MEIIRVSTNKNTMLSKVPAGKCFVFKDSTEIFMRIELSGLEPKTGEKIFFTAMRDGSSSYYFKEIASTTPVTICDAFITVEREE